MFWHLNNLILIPSLITNNCTKIEIGWEFVHDESNPSCISLLWIQMFKSVTRQALFETTQTNIRKRLSPCFLPLGLHFLSLCTSFYVYFQLLQNSCEWFVGYIYIYISRLVLRTKISCFMTLFYWQPTPQQQIINFKKISYKT